MDFETIKIDINNNIVIRNVNNAEIVIDTSNANEIHEKLHQLTNQQIGVLQQLIKEQGDKLTSIFKTMLNGVASQKNVVYGNIRAKSVRIGDEIHYHFYPKEETLPKKLTLTVPSLSADSIIGRKKELNDLKQLLFNKKEPILLNGFGGIGKTTLAQVYVSKYWDEYEHIIWITQEGINSFLLNFIIAEGMKVNLGIGDELKEPMNIFNAIIGKLNGLEDQPNLMVLDNVDESIEELRDKLPSFPKWHVLLTSRQELNGFTLKYLDFLDDKDAFLLFRKYYSLDKLTDQQIKQLISMVDNHTLSIELLAKTAYHQRYSFQTLNEALSLNLATDVKIGRHGEFGRIEKFTSYLCSLFTLSHLDENEIWLLQQMLCLPSDYHSYQLLIKLFNLETKEKSESFAPTIDKLSQKGWLFKNAESDSFKLHLILAEVIKQKQAPKFKQIRNLLSNITTILKIDQSKDNPVDKFLWINIGKTILKYAESIMRLRKEKRLVSLLQYNLAIVLKEFGNFDEARILIEKSISLNSSILGIYTRSNINRYSLLAIIYRDLGEYQKAKEILLNTISIQEKLHGKKHPNTISNYSNIGLILQDLEEFQQAKYYLEKAMYFDEEFYGINHPTTAIAYTNLGLALRKLQDYSTAKILLEKALYINEKTFKDESPKTAVSYVNLASVYEDLENYEDAKILFEKAIMLNEKNFGNEHPTTAVTYNNYALLLEKLGNFNRAKDFSIKAIDIAEKHLGLEHPITATYWSSIGVLFIRLKSYKDAKFYLGKATNFNEKKYGTESSITTTCYSNLGAAYYNLGEFDEAKRLLEKVLKVDLIKYGTENTNTAITYTNLAKVLIALNDYKTSFELSRKAVSILEESLQSGHPTLTSANENYNKAKQMLMSDTDLQESGNK